VQVDTTEHQAPGVFLFHTTESTWTVASESDRYRLGGSGGDGFYHRLRSSPNRYPASPYRRAYCPLSSSEAIDSISSTSCSSSFSSCPRNTGDFAFNTTGTVPPSQRTTTPSSHGESSDSAIAPA